MGEGGWDGGGGGGNEGLFGIWKFAPFISTFAPFISFHLLNICFHCHQFHPQVIRLDDSVKTGCRKVRCFDTELHKCQKTINLCRYRPHLCWTRKLCKQSQVVSNHSAVRWQLTLDRFNVRMPVSKTSNPAILG